MEINPLVPFLRLLTLCSLVCATHVHAQEVWLPLSDLGLTSETSGNALDFSALVPRGPAGRNGWSVVLPDAHIGFDSQRDPQRFLCASMVFSGLNGNIPDKAGSEALVRELRRTGYNLVRLHYIDAQLMAGRLKDFDFDPVQLDRLHYLLAKLKEGGIYWMVDGLTSDNAAYGDVQPHRYTKKYNAKLDVLTTEPGYAHWAALVARLWGMKNPYTGLPPLQDPAMLGLILVNEGSLGYLATIQGGRYPAVLAPLFRDWLKGRYVTDAALKASWAKEAKSDESLSGAVGLPESVRGGSPRDVDFARFVADLERSAYKRMERHVRQLGFRGLVTAFDSWGFFSADISRSAAQSIDMHSYHALPTIHGQPGSKMAQTSVHANTGRYLRELSNARQWGKPFTVSEYGQPFWNRWRHESAAWVPAMAAHQGWDAICQFAEAPIQLDYGPSPFRRRQAMYPFGTGADPIAHAGERLAAMLFLRGDVAPSRSRIRLHMDAEKSLGRNAGWEQVPETLSRLGFISAIGLDFGPLPDRVVPGELSVDLTGQRPGWLAKLESALVRSGLDVGTGGAGVLRDSGLIGEQNRSKPESRIFQSDTGQLLIDSAAGRIDVATARTAVVVLRGGDAAAGALSVSQVSGPALFAISALDNEPIHRSRRLLLWVLTDAINTGMTFEDEERTTIRELGTFPPMVRAVSGTIRFQSQNASAIKIWPLSLAGERRASIALTASAAKSEVALLLDTSKLPGGPALFFEIAVE